MGVPLTYRIGTNESGSYVSSMHKIIFLLLFSHPFSSYKRRVAHDIVEFIGSDDLCPVEAEGVAVSPAEWLLWSRTRL